MNVRHIASVSFGKDSLAMLLLILERGLPLDEVVFYDTGMEFKAIYDTRDRVLPLLTEHGVRYTELRPPAPLRLRYAGQTCQQQEERPSLRLFVVWRVRALGNRLQDAHA